VLARVQEALLGAPGRDWEKRLGEAGVACGVVNDVAGALAEPQTAARGLVVHNEHPAYGGYEHVRGPLPMEAGGGLRPAPVLGEHTTEALAELGYPPDRIDTLRHAGVIT
jgi:formyl-CoA transferase